MAAAHGTRFRYSNDGCRCDPCRDAQSVYARFVYANRSDEQKEKKYFYALRYKLKKHYGLTMEDVVRMLDEQGNRCKICQRDIEGYGFKTENDKRDQALVVDHDHNTGRVRGLLCRACNTGIGHLGEDVERMKRAIAYLEEN